MGGALLYSEDNCTVRNVDMLCQADVEGVAHDVLVNSEINWDAEGTYGVGGTVWVIYDDDGDVLCDSAYDVEIVKL